MQMVFYTFLRRVANVNVTCMLSSVMLQNIPQCYKSRIVMWKCFVSKCAHICGIVADLFLKVFTTTTIDTFRSNFLKLATKSYWKSWATWVLLWLKLLRGLKSLIINTIHSNCTLRPNTLLSLSGMTLVIELRPSGKNIDLEHFEHWNFRFERSRAQFLILNFRSERSRAEKWSSISSIRKFRAITERSRA